MRVVPLVVLALNAASGLLAAPAGKESADGFERLADLAALAVNRAKDIVDGEQKRGSTCTWSNVRTRREWGDLSRDERLNYIKAVKCLQSKPAKTPKKVVPGAKTRFDDWVATHVNQTQRIHFTGNFLAWHRYFTWIYEEALRNECGYTGTQPYWDWTKTAKTGLTNSPIFDGSNTSMSGDGEYIPNKQDIVIGGKSGLSPVYLPAGSGGGCVKSGPFKDMKVNLGQAALDTPGGTVISNPDGPLAYNPRCLKRDLSDKVNQRYSNITSVLNQILKPKNVMDFQMLMQGVPGSGDIGVHGGGHYSLGGDPGRDVYTSPGDPVFYLHHSMIDRVWWMWQMLSPKERQYGNTALMGTNTFLNQPPSPNTTVEDRVHYGWASRNSPQIKDLMSTLAGPFCYVYL